MSWLKTWLVCLAVVCGATATVQGEEVLIEAESFESHGGWQLDTQFITSMGSPYLLAHGLGRPVKDASTTVEFPATGKYHVFVRTKDWVARWKATGQPGRFQVLVNGQALPPTFGTVGAEWHWQPGGMVEIAEKKVSLALHDLTGFDGRCDAILFTTDEKFTPPNEGKILPQWRRKMLGLPEEPQDAGKFDLVVVGGGYSGMGAAISAARLGLKVALIQDRPVLGGNGSSEVRVWAMGLVQRGPYPHVGEIVAEFSDHAKKSPGTYEEFGDEKKEAIVRAEKNISLFLNHHAYQVEKQGQSIAAVFAFDTRTSAHKKFVAPLFVDGTGHGTIGFLADAAWDMAPTGRMGMSNMWAWGEGEKPVAFPETPWALDLAMKDFPYPRDHHGQWFWESGFDKDPLGDAEGIRDWNLRAVYGAFNAMKNRDGADKHTTAFLTWVAYIGGPRESRQLLGDVLLTQDDIVTKKKFKDGCVPSTWSIDLHYAKKQYAEKFPDNPFISIAVHDQRIDRNYGYPVPYRCFYSKNIPNLFMAGRCVSVTHEALGTVRVMKTCGMMGEVVGKAAVICTQQSCTPREVYEKYWDEMAKLLELPGAAHRASLKDKIEIPENLPPVPVIKPTAAGVDPKSLPGLVVDDRQAEFSGTWASGPGGLQHYVGDRYLYAGAKSKAQAHFKFKVPKSGDYEVRVSYDYHENRATNVPVTIVSATGTSTKQINQRQKPPLDDLFVSLGTFSFSAEREASISISTADTDGNVHVDAVQLISKP